MIAMTEKYKADEISNTPNNHNREEKPQTREREEKRSNPKEIIFFLPKKTRDGQISTKAQLGIRNYYQTS